MTEIKDPGAPTTDPMAENAARNALADRAEMFIDREAAVGSAEQVAEWIVKAHAVTWETDVNGAGVPVRRYVLRGAWEVDAEAVHRALTATAPTAGEIAAADEYAGKYLTRLSPGDVVTYRDRRDDGREWTIGCAGVYDGPRSTVSMTAAGSDEVAEQQYAVRGDLELIRRARS